MLFTSSLLFYIYSPLEQFDLVITCYYLFGNNFQATIIIAFAILHAWTYRSGVKGRLLGLIPIFSVNCYKFVLNTAKTNITSFVRYSFFPVLFFCFYSILFCNLLGLIPYTITLTSYFIFSSFFATAVYCGVNIIGIILNRSQFTSLFYPAGAPLAVAFMLPLIEVISYLARNSSLAIRLTSNMISGHILLKILGIFFWKCLNLDITIVPALILGNVLVILVALETMIAFLQSYIFLTLIVLYINDVVLTH